MKRENEELVSTLDTLIGVVSERLAELRETQNDDEFYKVRLGLAFLVGLRDREVRPAL